MSDIRIKMAKDLRDMSDMVGDLHWMAAKAVEDLTKKEGEIAKRDEELAACRVAVENCEVFRARVAELESVLYAERIDADLQRQELDAANSNLAGMRAELARVTQADAHYQAEALRLAAELAAIKAQEPVAWISKDGTYAEASTNSTVYGSHTLPLYAAPVSEAKAQGVVMPERWNVPRPMWKDARQPYGNPLNHADIEAAEKFNLALDEVARLNAAHAQQEQSFCEYCGGNDENPQDHCMDCTRPLQQVSVPDVSAMARILADRNADACNVNREDNWAIYGQDYIDDVTAMLAAAPAAPAADAVVVPHELLMRVLGPVTSEQYLNAKHELWSLIDATIRQKEPSHD